MIYLKELVMGLRQVVYGDDIKIWRDIVGDNDQFILKRDIDNLFNWSITNQMQAQ